MSVQPIPEGFHSITPYLTVNGADRLLAFLKQAFGASEDFVFRDEAGIRHAELQVGDSKIELGQAGEQWTPRLASLHYYVPDPDAVYRKAIDAGAKSLREPVDQDYGDREAGIEDPGGNSWWIATHKNAGAGKYAPEGLRSITMGLPVKGAAKFIDFLKAAFDAREQMCFAEAGLVHHAKISIGDSIVEVNDANDRFGPLTSALHYYAADSDNLYHRAIAAGAKSLREPVDESYGDRASSVIDPWGNHWYFATRIAEVATGHDS